MAGIVNKVYWSPQMHQLITRPEKLARPARLRCTQEHGEGPPEVQPLTRLYTIFFLAIKRYPFCIPSINNKCLFHMPANSLLVILGSV